MATEIASLFATIGANVTDFQAGMNQVQSGLKIAGGAMMKTGGIMSAAITAPLALIGKQAIGVAASFESQMNIMAVAAKQDADGLEMLRNAAIRVGADTELVGINAAQAADAMTNFYKAGLDTNQIMGDMAGYLSGNASLSGALRAAIDMAAASELELGSASQVVSIAMATFGIDAARATEITDSFVQAADASVTSVPELADAMKNIGPTFASIYGSTGDAVQVLGDMNTALAILSQRGISGSEAGTALKSMITNMMRPTKEVQGALRALNVQLYNADGSMRKLPDVMADLSSALTVGATKTVKVSRLTGEQAKEYERLQKKLASVNQSLQDYASGISGAGQSEKARAGAVAKLQAQQAAITGQMAPLAKLAGEYTTATKTLTEAQRNQYITAIAGTYGMKAMNTLLAEGEAGWNEMAGAIGSAASTQESAAARTKGFGAAMEQLQGSIETLMIKAITPLMQNSITPLIQKFTTFIGKIIELDPKILTLGIVIAGVVAAAGPLLLALGALSTILGVIASPVVLVIAGIVALGAAVIKATGGVGRLVETLRPFADGIRDIVSGDTLGAMINLGTIMTRLGIPPSVRESIVSFGFEVKAALDQTIKNVRTWATEFWGKIKAGFAEGGLAGAIKAALGNVGGITEMLAPLAETIKTGLSSAFTSAMTFISEKSPELEAALDGLFTGIQTGDFSGLLASLGPLGSVIAAQFQQFGIQAWAQFQAAFPTEATAITAFFDNIRAALEPFVSFVSDNLLPILAGIGASIMAYVIPALITMATTTTATVVPSFIAWAGAAATAAAATVVALAPIIAPILAIGAAVGLLVAAWTNDWGGIATFLTGVWTGTLLPALQSIWNWLSINIPAAIQAVVGFFTGTLIPTLVQIGATISGAVNTAIAALSALWTGTLLPAIQAVTAFITGTLMPLFQSMANLFGAVVGLAITMLAGLWQNVLLPALRDVWAFLQTNVLPILESVANFMATTFVNAGQAVADLWNTTLAPALQTVWDWIANKLHPVVQAWSDLLSGNLNPAIAEVADVVGEKLSPALDFLKGVLSAVKGGLDAIGNTIKFVTGLFNTLTNAVKNFKPPDVLTPGSPTPFEEGLRGIASALIEAAGQFAGFTKAFKPGQAKVFQDMAKGLKDLGQALLVVAQLGSLSLGGPINITSALEQFAAAVTEAMGQIAKIDAQFGEKTIKKLRKDAQRLRQILDAVAIDLSSIKVAQLPDLTLWGEQVFGVFNRVMEVIATLSTTFGAKVIKNAADIAQSATTIVNFIKPAIDGLAAMAEYTPLGSLQEQAQNMADRIKEVVGTLALMSLQFSGNATEMAASFYAAAQTILGSIKPAIDALAALADWTAVGSLADKTKVFAAQMLEVVDGLRLAAEGLGTEGLTAASEFWSAARSLIDLVKPGIDALVALASYAPVKNLASLIKTFAGDLVTAASTLAAELGRLSEEWATSELFAAKVTPQVQSVIGLLGSALDFTLPESKTWAVDLPIYARLLVDAAQIVRDALDKLPELWADADMFAAKVTGNIQNVLGMLGTALDFALPESETWANDIGTFAALLVYAAQTVEQELSKLPALWADAEMFAAKAADNVSKVSGLLSTGLKFELPTDLISWQYGLEAFGKLLVLGAQTLALELERLPDAWAEAEFFAAKAADNISKVLGLLGVNLAFEMPRSDFATAIDRFVTGLELAAGALLAGIDRIVKGPLGASLEAAAEAAGQIGEVVGLLGLGQLFAEVAQAGGYGNMTNLATYVTNGIETALGIIVPKMESLQQTYQSRLQALEPFIPMAVARINDILGWAKGVKDIDVAGLSAMDLAGRVRTIMDLFWNALGQIESAGLGAGGALHPLNPEPPSWAKGGKQAASENAAGGGITMQITINGDLVAQDPEKLVQRITDEVKGLLSGWEKQHAAAGNAGKGI